MRQQFTAPCDLAGRSRGLGTAGPTPKRPEGEAFDEVPAASHAGRPWLMMSSLGGSGLILGLFLCSMNIGPAHATSAKSDFAEVMSPSVGRREVVRKVVDLGYPFEDEVAALTLFVDSHPFGKLVGVNSTCPCVTVQERIDVSGNRYLRFQAIDQEMPARPTKLSIAVRVTYENSSGLTTESYDVQLHLVPPVDAGGQRANITVGSSLNQVPRGAGL